MTILAPGIYRLKQDVTNPHPDRRMKYDWRKNPTWTKGTVFCLENDFYDLPMEDGPENTRRINFMVMFMNGKGRSTRVSDHDDLFKLLAPLLEPMGTKESTLDILLDKDPNSDLARRALRRLLKSEKLTLADIEDALAED